jgi:hypothetical protein
MMRAGLVAAVIVVAVSRPAATEAPQVSPQVTASWSDYDDFMKLSAQQRRMRFSAISTENREIIIQTHVRRWFEDNRGRLSDNEVAVFEEIVAFISSDHFRKPDGTFDKRSDTLLKKMRCRVAPEDVRAATNVFAEASESPGQTLKWSYLRQAKCWIEWTLEGLVDYVPSTGR